MNINKNVPYAFYSKVLNTPFDSVDELMAAEDKYFAAEKAKADAAAAKKADATKVEAAFKEMNAARKSYKEDMKNIVEAYSVDLHELKCEFEDAKKVVADRLATAEHNYEAALKEFTDKHPEGFHLTLKDGDFETTISSETKKDPNENTVKDILNLLFNSI